MKKTIAFFLFFLFPFFVVAQFPPQAMQAGSDAVHADDTAIVAWATGCKVQRGWLNIMDTSLGKTTVGDEAAALGAPDLKVLSLGDRGVATLTFDYPIKDDSGPDFVVFENGFLDPMDSNMAFLELAYVAVSSDGAHFVTFPSICKITDSQQVGSFDYTDARKVHNLAGKYINGFGTPFDLSELAGDSLLDIQNIRYVRITDAIGTIDEQYASYDSEGNRINDPFPTAFPSGGFDLNAVGVLHLNLEHAGIRKSNLTGSFKLWPNPADNIIFLETPSRQHFSYAVFSTDGRILKQGSALGKAQIEISTFASGTYFIKCFSEKKTETMIWNKW